MPAADKQANRYQVGVNQQQWKPPQTENKHDNSNMLTIYLLFYAQVKNWFNLL